MNRQIIAELDLSGRMNSGDVMVAIGLFYGNEINGEETHYEDFAVKEIP